MRVPAAKGDGALDTSPPESSASAINFPMMSAATTPPGVGPDFPAVSPEEPSAGAGTSTGTTTLFLLISKLKVFSPRELVGVT